MTKTYTETTDREFSDKEDIYSYEKEREAKEPYFLRAGDLAAIDTGLEKNVKTYIISSPTIYGTGTGLFHNSSIQIPVLTKTAIAEGQSIVIGEGAGVWDYIHISDVALLYETLIDKLLNGTDLPSGKKGIYFCGTGRFSWAELSSRIAKAGVEAGALKTTDIKSLGLEEAAQKFGGFPPQLVELGFTSK
jgi:nucleoside-diphosphate-sugar epimerase